jgi:hypothetical protein
MKSGVLLINLGTPSAPTPENAQDPRRSTARAGRSAGGQPGGISPRDGAVGVEFGGPPVALLDAVVAPAQAHEVRGRGGTGRPGPDVVEVALTRGGGAAGEAAGPVP